MKYIIYKYRIQVVICVGDGQTVKGYREKILLLWQWVPLSVLEQCTCVDTNCFKSCYRCLKPSNGWSSCDQLPTSWGTTSCEASEEKSPMSLKTIFPHFCSPRMVSLCPFILPCWEGWWCKKKTQVRETWMLQKTWDVPSVKTPLLV